MNLNALFTVFFTAAYLLPDTFNCLASETTNTVNDGDDDEYYDLEGMTDEELEEICTSRGFELVRELDAETGEQAVVYSHQDYVDAASECLQIEADLEEILETHPEILEDVKRENERMMNERDRLLEQLHRQSNGTEPKAEQDRIDATAEQAEEMGGSEELEEQEEVEEVEDQNTPDTISDSEKQPNNKLTYGLKEMTLEVIEQMKADFTKLMNFVVPKQLREKIQSNGTKPITEQDGIDATAEQADEIVGSEELEEQEELEDQNTTLTIKSDNEKQPNNKLTYGMKEITLEVIEQMKADFTKIINFVVPKQLREKIQLQVKHQMPALKSLASVAKDMGVTAYDMARRYLMAFMDKKGGESQDVSSDEILPDEAGRKGEEQTLASSEI